MDKNIDLVDVMTERITSDLTSSEKRMFYSDQKIRKISYKDLFLKNYDKLHKYVSTSVPNDEIKNALKILNNEYKAGFFLTDNKKEFLECCKNSVTFKKQNPSDEQLEKFYELIQKHKEDLIEKFHKVNPTKEGINDNDINFYMSDIYNLHFAYNNVDVDEKQLKKLEHAKTNNIFDFAIRVGNKVTNFYTNLRFERGVNVNIIDKHMESEYKNKQTIKNYRREILIDNIDELDKLITKINLFDREDGSTFVNNIYNQINNSMRDKMNQIRNKLEFEKDKVYVKDFVEPMLEKYKDTMFYENFKDILDSYGEIEYKDMIGNLKRINQPIPHEGYYKRSLNYTYRDTKEKEEFAEKTLKECKKMLYEFLKTEPKDLEIDKLITNDNSRNDIRFYLAFDKINKVNEITILSKQLKDNSSEYAKTFDTKKNINQKTLEQMEKSPFNKVFKDVEFDNEVEFKETARENQKEELSAMDILHDEFLKITKLFEKHKPNEISLKFKKMDHRRSNGIFFPTKNCIAININGNKGISSFFHEYGHFVDYNNDTKQVLSVSDTFRDFVFDYKAKLRELAKENEIEVKFDYLCNNQEIFARGFEWYLSELGLVSNFLKEKNDIELNIENGYIFNELSDDVKTKMLSFYENVFEYKDIINEIKKELTVNKDIEVTKEEVLPVDKKVEKIKNNQELLEENKTDVDIDVLSNNKTGKKVEQMKLFGM